jgi:hypothetical protein
MSMCSTPESTRMSHSGFNKLPPELVVQIVESLDTPHDLYSLIVSSKYVYQTFQFSRVAILATVMMNALPHGNIYLAVAACKAAATSKAWYAGNDHKSISKQREELLVS